MKTSPDIDLLILIETPGMQSEELMNKLRAEKYYYTIISSTRGINQDPVCIILVGIHHTRRVNLLKTIRKYCYLHTQFIPAQTSISYIPTPLPMVETKLGGASIFEVEVEKFTQV